MIHNSLKLALALSALFLAACTSKPLQQELPQPGAASLAAPPTATKAGWEKEWEDTIAAARKEGKVVVYIGGSTDVRAALAKSFGERFGIVLEAIAGSGRELSEKLLREKRAGLSLGDVYQSGVTTQIITLKPAGALSQMDSTFILPELRDPQEIKKVWWDGKLPWVDDEHKAFGFLAYPQEWVAINTTLVRPEEMKSWKDLLNPKWKGKIISFDLTTTGPGGKLLITGDLVMGMDYWRQLAQQNLTMTRDHRQVVEFVAHGKSSIAIAPITTFTTQFKEAGAPVQLLTAPEEGGGLIVGFGGLGLIDKPAHPNAAKLFVNWLLSREGLGVYTKAYNGQSARLDVPTDFLSREVVRLPGAKYVWTDTEALLLKESSMYQEAREIFGVR